MTTFIKDPETHRTHKNFCPHCGMKLDAATNMESTDTPGPGDITICIYCTSWLIFNDDMTLRSASQQDIDELPKEFLKRLYITTKALEDFNRLHGRP